MLSTKSGDLYFTFVNYYDIICGTTEGIYEFRYCNPKPDQLAKNANAHNVSTLS